VLSLLYAIPIWILAVLVTFQKIQVIQKNAALVGGLAGFLPSIYFWSEGFTLDTKSSEMVFLFILIVLPPTLISIGSALTATKIAFPREGKKRI
jgi:hypothetical protein